MLKRHGDPGALNASGVVEYFTTDPLGVSISRNRMTRVMAGEFCCKDGAPARYTGAAMYKLALERLDEFCVVGLTSRVQVGQEAGRLLVVCDGERGAGLSCVWNGSL